MVVRLRAAEAFDVDLFADLWIKLIERIEKTLVREPQPGVVDLYEHGPRQQDEPEARDDAADLVVARIQDVIAPVIRRTGDPDLLRSFAKPPIGDEIRCAWYGFSSLSSSPMGD
jgi:hypothetical protein